MLEPAGEFAVRKIAGEAILVPVRAGVGDLDSIFTLNEVGAEIWQGLQETRGPAAIVEWVTARFDVGREEAEQDVQAFLAMLLEAGLVREVRSR